MRYYDAFAESGFHSAFLTTYAFGAQAFEDIPFSRLRGSGCRNITVLADRQMVNQSFAEYGPPKFAGTSYHLVKADAPGAFHPKITLLIYHEPTGETEMNLGLMQLIDRQFLDTPFYGVRQMTWHLQNEGHAVN